jgi:hypothetical protein
MTFVSASAVTTGQVASNNAIAMRAFIALTRHKITDRASEK